MFFAFAYKGGSLRGVGWSWRGCWNIARHCFRKCVSVLNDAEYHLKNYGDRGGCYPPRPIRPWWITPSESFIIHSKWFPVQKQAKSYLPPSMLSSLSCLSASLGDKELFSTANSKYSPNSRCLPSSYLLAVLAVFSR